MIIETKNLVKIYGQRKVVNNVSLQVEQGTIVGLLGPNGAGKTTTFYMVVGIAKPDSGTVTLDGEDISQGGYQPAFHVPAGPAGYWLSSTGSVYLPENDS